MNLEDFQLLDNETIDNFIIKRLFSKVYHQQAANLTDSDPNVDFIFDEIITYHQIDYACLQYEVKVERDNAKAAGRVLVDGDVIRFLNNSFAYCKKGARLSTPGDQT